MDDAAPARLLGARLEALAAHSQEGPIPPGDLAGRPSPQRQGLELCHTLLRHHSDKGWSSATRFSDLIDLPDTTKHALAPHLIDFQVLLDDLTRQSDAQIHARALTDLGEIVTVAFKHLPYEADPLPLLERLAPLLLRVMTAPTGLAALSAILRYALQVTEVDLGALRSLVTTHLGKSAEEAIMTTAEKLQQEGIAKGEARGRAEGRAALLLKLLKLKFGPLAPSVTDRVQSASIDELDLWAERILSATALEDVLR